MIGAKESTQGRFPYSLIPGAILERLRDSHNGHVNFDSHDGLTRFFAPRQAEKGLILQETFLVANTRVEVLLEMPFLTLNSVDMRFAEVLVRRTFLLYDKSEKFDFLEDFFGG